MKHTIAREEKTDFFFLGIVSAEPDYRLSVMMNKNLGTDLRKCPDDIAVNAGTVKKSFTCFASVTPPLMLVSNRSEGAIFVRRLKNIDFLLIIRGHHDGKKAEALAAAVRSIPEVTAVFFFDSREISDRNLSLLGVL